MKNTFSKKRVDFFQNTSKSDFIFNWHFLFSMPSFCLCLDKAKPIPMKWKSFSLHWTTCFWLTKIKFFQVWSLPLHPLQNWKPSVIPSCLDCNSDFPPSVYRYENTSHLPGSIQAQKIMAECSGNLFRALGDEKFSSTFNFVGTSCNRGDGHHISVPHIGDTQGTFSRQFLKLLVAFMVWEAFFFQSAFHVLQTKDQN